MSRIEEKDELLIEKEKKTDKKVLILFNDDDNTFDWVIQSLVEICKHDVVQAEQCSLIVHNNGKCQVKFAEIKVLEPMAHSLLDRGLTVEIQ